LPKPVSLPITDEAPAVPCEESDCYGERPGDDPSEIFNIRSYMPGDAIDRIHWKLSSKTDKLLVREFGCPVERKILLLVDYRKPDRISGNHIMQDASKLLTMTYSVSLHLIGQQQSFALVWFDEVQGVLRTVFPDSEETLTKMFCEIYASMEKMVLSEEALLAGISDTIYSSVTLISNRQSPVLLQTLRDKISAHQKNVFLTGTESAENLQTGDVKIQFVRSENICENVSQIII
jgi:hypothetical protein